MSKIETALFTHMPDLVGISPIERAWRRNNGKRVTVVYNPEADVPKPMDEFQVIFEGEEVNPHTVYRKELSDLRSEE